MLKLRLADHVVAEVARKVGLGPQVDRPPTQQAREFRLHASERDVPGCLTGFELHEQVDVAIGAPLAPEDGTVQRDASDVVARAELVQCVLPDRELLAPLAPR